MPDLAFESSWVYSSGLDCSTDLGWTRDLGKFCNCGVLMAEIGVSKAWFRTADCWVLSFDFKGRQICAGRMQA